jgi:hypothetical protein
MAVNDGSANASVGSPQHSNLLDSYGANRPAWDVAGVDYHVGVPEGLALKNPATISMAGVSVNATTKIVTVTGNNVTLDGYDFSLSGGWQVSVQAANTTITNSNFLIGSNNLAPIISTAAASNMTVSYCTIDGAGKDPGWGGLISYRGNGFTVEQSWLKNAGGDMIQQIDGGANSTVVIQHNLIENGGLASGAHGDYTQLAGGPFNVAINYNTTMQNGGTTQGLMTEYVASGEIGNNTMVGNPSYFVSVDNSSIKTTVTVHDNYYDAGGYGFVYPNSGPDDGNAKSIYIHNVNMKNGAVLQDSNAPTTPPPTAPSAPTISSFSNDTGVAGDKITSDNTLTLTGSAAANSTVKVFDGTTQIGTATANSSGAWSYTTSALADGNHSLTAKVTDASGNTSSASAALAVKVDTTAPAVPVALNDTIVNGNQVLLNGTAEANSTVKVYDGLALVGTATAKADGTWSVTTSALSPGSHDLTATATDVAGNTSAMSLPLDPIIGGPAPGAPTIASYSNDSGVAGDGITNDNTLTLTGTAAANSTVKVFDGATQIGTATASASGAWSYTTSALADGAHNLTAKATDASGQTSAASAALAVKIDTTAPNAPTIAAPSNNANGSVNLTGTAEANSTVKVFDGATQIGTATANGNGAWSLTTGTLATGNHSFTAKAADVAGNTSAASAVVVGNIPPTTPATPDAPKITSYSNDSGVAGDGITNDNTLTLTGTAAANSTVKVFDGAAQIGTATANASGTWTYTTAALADGGHSLTAKVTNAAGNTSAASSALAVKIDTSAPNAPTIATSGSSLTAADKSANPNTVTVTGSAEANSTVKVFDGATQIGTATADSSGAWNFTSGTLATGNHTFTSKAMDAAGNTSSASAGLVVNVAPTAPPPAAGAPTIVSYSNDSGVAGDGITNDNTLTLTGTAKANSVVLVYDGATPVGAAIANSSGAWSFTTRPLADGSHSVTAKTIDATGKFVVSSPLDVKIDTTAPNAPTIATPSSSAGGVVKLAGTAEANSKVAVFDGAKQLGIATTDDKGTWSLTTDALATGNHSFTAKATDVAGNTGAASKAVAVSITPPTTPPTTPTTPDAPKIASYSNDSGVAGDGITNDNTLTLTGTAAANSKVIVFNGGVQIGTATANAGGAWSHTTAALADGGHNFTAKVMDAAGNSSAASAALALKIDTAAPDAPKIAAGDGVVNADHVTLTGTAEANSKVMVFDGVKQLGIATTNDKGAWTYAADSLSDGSHSFTTKAMDAAGNTSGSSASFDVKIDTHTATPSAEFTKVVQNWNDTVTFKGTADPFSQITIYDNGSAKALGSVKVGSDGNWSYKTPSAVSDAVHNFTATVTDKAGNTSAVPGSAVLGTNGNDVLKGTSGNDLFKGNGGQDTFVFTSNFGADVINNFSATGRSHDVVQFSKSVFDNFADVLAHAAQSGHDVVIDAGGGNTLTLKDTKLAALDKTDFHFA